jgi:7-carboxy-7-deazaguanine synthase
MLAICEIFYSLQGEGPFMGRPAVFVRLSGCVLPYCEFCDTPEALGQGYPMALDTILRQVLSYKCSLVVITGGEPFLQWKQGLWQLSQLLLQEGISIHYETSGRAGIPDNVNGIVVLSPKSGKWPSLEVLKKAHFLKPLVDDDPQNIVDSIRKSGFPPDRVWLMPLGRTREEQIARMPRVWDLCVLYGYCLSPRLHILAHNHKKGI